MTVVQILCFYCGDWRGFDPTKVTYEHANLQLYAEGWIVDPLEHWVCGKCVEAITGRHSKLLPDRFSGVRSEASG